MQSGYRGASYREARFNEVACNKLLGVTVNLEGFSLKSADNKYMFLKNVRCCREDVFLF